MSDKNAHASNPVSAEDRRWKDLYAVGGGACFLSLLVVVVAVAAYFIWPYKGGTGSAESVFILLQTDRLGGLMALDLLFLVGTLVSILPVLALYAALRRVNESYALIALALGLIAIVSLIPSRPLLELVQLSGRYAAAATEAERSILLTAGESMLAFFDGTAWMVNVLLSSLSNLISSILMLRSRAFGKTVATVGIVSNGAALFFWIPGVGLILLFTATLGGIALLILEGRALLRLARSASIAPEVG